jgi:hypothetical protein
MKLVTIKTFDNGISAHILKNKIESEGITCFIHDENIVTLNPLYNVAVGGIKLKVYEEDVQQALSIIASVEVIPYTDEQNQIIKCPDCESTELYSDFKSMKSSTGIISAIISFVLTVFPIYYKSVYRCKQCDAEFQV